MLVLMGTGYKSFNTFTANDVPLLIRTYAQFRGDDQDGLFAERQLRRLFRTPEGLSRAIILGNSENPRTANGAKHALEDIAKGWIYNPENFDDAVKVLNVLREHEDENVRFIAYETLFDLVLRNFEASPEKAFKLRDSLVVGLKDPSDIVVKTVIDHLQNRYSEDWKYPIDLIKPFLDDEDLRVRLNTAILLAYIDPDDLEPMPLIIDNLETSDYELQGKLIGALRSYGEAASDAIPKLLNIIETDPKLKEPEFPAYTNAMAATYAISFTGDPDGKILERLSELMYDDNQNVRMVSVEGLGKLREHGIPALPALKEKVEDPNEDWDLVKFSAVNSITMIYHYSRYAGVEFDETPEIEYLIYLLDKEDPMIRHEAAWGLMRFRDKAESALPKLKELLETEGGTDEESGSSFEMAIQQIELYVGERNNPRHYSVMPQVNN